jgi:selenium metabolism protein YedF
MKTIDCRGLACPQPVLTAKDALDRMDAGQVKVVVDNEAAVGNVTRFAKSQGCQVEARGRDDEYELIITKGAPSDEGGAEAVSAAADSDQPRLVVKVSSRHMGSGSDELGRVLMTAFIKSLADATIRPAAVVFYNSGAYLTCQGSDLVEAIEGLASSGVQILTCGTCLDFFQIKDRLAVGSISNMYEIVETLSGADRVVAP